MALSRSSLTSLRKPSFIPTFFFVVGALVGSTFPVWAQTSPAARTLEQEIARRRLEMPEFKYAHDQAKRSGVRLWTFGGTSATLASRIARGATKLELETAFHPGQDLDLVVDGTAEQAKIIATLLQRNYPRLQAGSKRAAWEVRTLRTPMGPKEWLVDDLGNPNPAIVSQNSDSMSNALIELTTPGPGQPLVRDLRSPLEGRPGFLEDLAQERVSFYVSPTHDSTARAAEGHNPSILSVLRLVSKASYLGLSISDEDFKKAKHIVNRFSAWDLMSEYARRRLDFEAQKIIQGSRNLEETWALLDRLGLRKKLVALGKVREVGSTSWWMSREPLPSMPLGQGTGETAASMGFSTVAHDVREWEHYRVLWFNQRDTGATNVFRSRKGAAGELAAHGDGFYVSPGTQGAHRSPYTLRYTLHPEARHGSDFQVVQTGIRVMNARALVPSATRLAREDCTYQVGQALQSIVHPQGFSRKTNLMLAGGGIVAMTLFQMNESQPKAPKRSRSWFDFSPKTPFDSMTYEQLKAEEARIGQEFDRTFQDAHRREMELLSEHVRRTGLTEWAIMATPGWQGERDRLKQQIEQERTVITEKRSLISKSLAEFK